MNQKKANRGIVIHGSRVSGRESGYSVFCFPQIKIGATGAQVQDSWQALENDIRSCTACRLAETRTNVVIGRGCPLAGIIFIGEGPGEQEDEQGLPFVGRAGKLLDYALEGLGFPEESYYIANIVKCRPPKNRVPQDDEALACLPFLRRQMRLVGPKIIVCLGATAVRHVIGKDQKITKIRGKWIDRKGWLIMPTFHPAALLRDESKKPAVWFDLREVRAAYGSIAESRLTNDC
jgi:DNA polymerase